MCEANINPAGTDREAPATSNGEFFTNSCAPGYTILIAGATGSQVPICSGLCAAGNISSDPTETGNDTGRDAASAKLPNQAAPAIGNGLCTPDKKGSSSGGPQNCVFLWKLTVNGAAPEIAPEYLDTLGFCFSFQQYLFDSNGDMTPDRQFPDCKTLPKRSAATPGDTDDAADFGCQRFAESQAAATPESAVTKHLLRVGLDHDVVVTPHLIVRH